MGKPLFNDLLAVGFLVGLIVIYIPQFYKITSKKTSHGFSTWFIFLGHTGSFLACLNALIFYIDNWWTCQGTIHCGEKFLGLGLIIIQWFLYWVLYLLFVIYYPPLDKRSYEIVKSSWWKRISFPTWTFIISHLIGLIFLGITLGVLAYHHWHNVPSTDLKTLIVIIEIGITGMFLIHYIPQIYETYHLKKAGSLSLITLALMTPGTFFWTVFLATQSYLVPNSKGESNPVVWVPYLIVGFFQAILLVMGIYYDRQEKKRIGPYAILIEDGQNRDSEEENFFSED